jgi:hypothetical protein
MENQPKDTKSTASKVVKKAPESNLNEDGLKPNAPVDPIEFQRIINEQRAKQYGRGK